MIYISGPITKPNPMHNTHAAVKIASRLMRAGYTPFVPHLCILWDSIQPEEYEDWIAYDLRVLESCDLLVRIPGESKGADIEEQDANRLGIVVIHLPSTDPEECLRLVQEIHGECLRT